MVAMGSAAWSSPSNLRRNLLNRNAFLPTRLPAAPAGIAAKPSSAIFSKAAPRTGKAGPLVDRLAAKGIGRHSAADGRCSGVVGGLPERLAVFIAQIIGAVAHHDDARQECRLSFICAHVSDHFHLVACIKADAVFL